MRNIPVHDYNYFNSNKHRRYKLKLLFLILLNTDLLGNNYNDNYTYCGVAGNNNSMPFRRRPS